MNHSVSIPARGGPVHQAFFGSRRRAPRADLRAHQRVLFYVGAFLRAVLTADVALVSRLVFVAWASVIAVLFAGYGLVQLGSVVVQAVAGR